MSRYRVFDRYLRRLVQALARGDLHLLLSGSRQAKGRRGLQVGLGSLAAVVVLVLLLAEC